MMTRSLLAMLVFILIITVAMLTGAEAYLWKLGYRPGSLTSDEYFLPVDSMYVRNDYATDTDGLLKVSPEKRDLVNGIITGKIKSPPNLWSLNLEGTIGNLIQDFDSLNREENFGGDFGKFIKRLKSFHPDSISETDKAYIYYSLSPINEDGFRSIAFKNYQTEKKKILLLGDSFTWGLSATPTMYSFPDLLASKGYVVFNTGIVGADPAQYLAMAEKYVPLLKPDVVIVNFFMGNDPMAFYREVKPEQPYIHVTNFGWLNAYQNGCYLSVEEAYNRTLNELLIAYQSNSWFSRLCAKTNLTTRLWHLLLKAGVVKNDYQEEVANCQEYRNPPVSEFYINGIRKTCEENSSKLILSIIPEKEDIGDYKKEDSRFMKKLQNNFSSATYHYPENLKHKDFPEDGHHFNNQGSEKYAAFLDFLIDSITAN